MEYLSILQKEWDYDMEVEKGLGCVRLTLFWIKNKWNNLHIILWKEIEQDISITFWPETMPKFSFVFW